MKGSIGKFYKKHKKHFWFFLPVLLIVLFDQLFKLLIKNNFSLGESISLIPGFLSLTYVQNTGAGFGLLKDMGLLLIFVSIFVIGIILYQYDKIKIKEKLLLFSTAFVLGGAIGNLIDRIAYGYVVDFVDFLMWPAFNLADTMITIGVFGLVIYFWKKK